MNTREKYFQEVEHQEFMQKQQTQIYYLHRQLKKKQIKYNSRTKTVYPTSLFTDDKHVQKLLTNHNYTVQTIIE